MTSRIEICPICGEGHLQPRINQEEVEYKGQKGMTPLYYSICDTCGSEQADAVQTRNNKRAMLAFKKTVDGLLTGTEIKALRIRLGINQTQAADIFGGGPVAFSKYENDDVMQSEAMDKLLRLAAEVPDVFKYLAQKADIGLIRSSSSVNRSHYALYVFGENEVKFDIENPKARRPLLRSVSSSPTVHEPTLRYG
jgi:HTH-type transcriptional regulator / antitoxin MqsA